MQAKNTFKTILIITAILLLFLPVFVTSAGILTKIIESNGWYRFLAENLVPFETRIIAGLLGILGYQAEASYQSVSIFRNGLWSNVWITWNCIGWQSIILFLITLVVGLQGNYLRTSKLEVIVIGILGTVLVNILRIFVITWLIFNFNLIPSIILHDYASAFILIIWLAFFWWFSYRFILEEKV